MTFDNPAMMILNQINQENSILKNLQTAVCHENTILHFRLKSIGPIFHLENRGVAVGQEGVEHWVAEVASAWFLSCDDGGVAVVRSVCVVRVRESDEESVVGDADGGGRDGHRLVSEGDVPVGHECHL